MILQATLCTFFFLHQDESFKILFMIHGLVMWRTTILLLAQRLQLVWYRTVQRRLPAQHLL